MISRQPISTLFPYTTLFRSIGLDMTRRDLQGEAKKLGRPWEIGKAFEHSAPATALIPASEIGHPTTGAIWLEDRKSTRLNSSHSQISYAVFCLKKKKH